MKHVSKLFKALNDETRLRIVGLLSHGEMCVCDLTHVLGMPQPTVSRHLAHLKNANLITDRRSKTWAYYRLSEDMRPFAHEILASLARHMLELDQAQKDVSVLKEYRNCSERNCDPSHKKHITYS